MTARLDMQVSVSLLRDISVGLLTVLSTKAPRRADLPESSAQSPFLSISSRESQLNGTAMIVHLANAILALPITTCTDGIVVQSIIDCKCGRAICTGTSALLPLHNVHKGHSAISTLLRPCFTHSCCLLLSALAVFLVRPFVLNSIVMD